MALKKESELTLIDAFNQFWWVYGGLEKKTLTIVGLYFYLVKQWNDCGRSLQFRHQNNYICEKLGISKPTLIDQRNKLKQCGLINFYSKGKGDENITYEILVIKEVKKSNDFTSDFTSHFTSDFTYKQSIYFCNGEGREVKSFDFLKTLLLKDESLRLRWLNYGYKEETFERGIDSFLSLKQNETYKDFQHFRRNFFYWVPNYVKELKSIDESKPEKNNSIDPNYRLKKIL